MPLDRAHITATSAVMLPFYTLTDLVFGLVFIFDPQDRLALAPSMDAARAIMPLEVFGGMWLALAVVMVSAWFSRNRDSMLLALHTSGLLWFLWSGVSGASVFLNPAVTYLAGWFGLTLTVAHYASIRSLHAREV